MHGDLEILVRLQNREQAALETAIRRYSGYVAAVARKTLGPDCTRQDIEELTSDAFVALWANAGKLRGDSDLKYWLAVVVRNASLRRRVKSVGTVPLEENLVFDRSPTSQTEKRERIRQVREAVDSLEPTDREIFLRHYFWHQPVRQIAEELGKNQSSIKSRLSRGREKLRKILLKEDCPI